MNYPLIFAHRGSSYDYPENTIIAFKHSISSGADGIELDVHLTKDNELVVIHDETVDRTTDGTGNVRDHTLAELKQLDAGNWFSSLFKGEKIPTLNEVLCLFKTNSLLLNIELKNDIIEYNGIENLVIELLKAHRMLDRVIISSFNHNSLVRAKAIEHDVRTAILVAQELYHPWDYAKTVKADDIHCHKEYSSFDELLKHDMNVRVYTVNCSQKITDLCRKQIHGIFTDVPQKAVSIRNKT